MNSPTQIKRICQWSRILAALCFTQMNEWTSIRQYCKVRINNGVNELENDRIDRKQIKDTIWFSLFLLRRRWVWCQNREYGSTEISNSNGYMERVCVANFWCFLVVLVRLLKYIGTPTLCVDCLPKWSSHRRPHVMVRPHLARTLRCGEYQHQSKCIRDDVSERFG